MGFPAADHHVGTPTWIGNPSYHLFLVSLLACSIKVRQNRSLILLRLFSIMSRSSFPGVVTLRHSKSIRSSRIITDLGFKKFKWCGGETDFESSQRVRYLNLFQIAWWKEKGRRAASIDAGDVGIRPGRVGVLIVQSSWRFWDLPEDRHVLLLQETSRSL